MMVRAEGHEGGLSVRDQIERYRTAFIAVVTMVVIAAGVGGYVLSQQNLKLPGWVPILGREFFILKADFQTGQAVIPGQGQAVTIAGAKIGEVESVELRQGVALVTMKVTPKYARLYRDATLLLRPKTQLQDMTIEVNPGSRHAGHLNSGEVIPLAQTAPNVNFDEFLAGLDTETRAYLQELLAGLGQGLKNNGKSLAAVFKRFSPTARALEEISSELEVRHGNIARSIHNFRLLMEALGGKDKQLAQLVDASNAVFATFAKEDANLQKTLRLLPGALHKTGIGLGKLATSSKLVGPTLRELQPFASALAPAQEATKQLSEKTAPIIKNQIRPFARQILPVVNQLHPASQQLAEAFPKLTSGFSVISEFFNELAYNPGQNQAGFLFFLDWANHNLNSVLSSGDGNSVLPRSLIYLNCEILKFLTGVAEVNKTVNLVVGLLNPPTRETCVKEGLLPAGTKAGASLLRRSEPAAGVFSGLSPSVFGREAGPPANAPAAGTGGGH